jgi:hypothetical protein
MIISIGAGKALGNIQHHFLVKALKKLVVYYLYLNIIMAIYERPIANSILNGEKLKHFL